MLSLLTMHFRSLRFQSNVASHSFYVLRIGDLVLHPSDVLALSPFLQAACQESRDLKVGVNG
jgi:hypothetical protein